MRKVVSLVLCFLLAGTMAVKADDLNDIQKQLNKIQNSISSKKEELDNINKNKQKVEQDIKSLDSSMTSAADKANSLNASVEQLNSDIASSQKEAEKAQKEYDEQSKVFKERVRAMYISGTTSYLDVIFNSKDFSDMLTRFEYVKRIMDYDKNLLKNMEDAKKNLESWKTEVERKKASTVSLKKQADAEVKNLQELTDKKKDVMSDLDNDKVAFEKAIKEEEEQSNNIAAMIKQKEDAKRKQEEANKQKSGNKTTNNKPPEKPVVSNGPYYKVLVGKYRISSLYGKRIHPIQHYEIFHAGIDIAADTGTPVHAYTDGEIIYAGVMGGYGNVVMIDHGNIVSVYAHNSSLCVRAGQQVKGGQVISYVGSTGNSTGPHLHFEIRQANGATVDPLGMKFKPVDTLN